MKSVGIWKAPILFVFVFLMVYNVNAQRVVVGVAGYVTNEQGNTIANVDVMIENINTSKVYTTTTNSEGLYAVSIEAEDGDVLRATAGGGNATCVVDTNLLTQWLNVSTSIYDKPFVSFSYEPQHPIVNETVLFHSRIVSPSTKVVYWNWDFGDGNKSNLRNPEHIYTKPGTYKVVLKVKDEINQWSSCTHFITVSESSPLPPSPEEKPYTSDILFSVIYAILGMLLLYVIYKKLFQRGEKW